MTVPNGSPGPVTRRYSRFIEDWGFVVGLLLGTGYVVSVEILPTACYALGRCANTPVGHPFPWVVVSIVALCIAPKTVGKASAGKVWEILAGRLGRKDT